MEKNLTQSYTGVYLSNFQNESEIFRNRSKVFDHNEAMSKQNERNALIYHICNSTYRTDLSKFPKFFE